MEVGAARAEFVLACIRYESPHCSGLLGLRFAAKVPGAGPRRSPVSNDTQQISPGRLALGSNALTPPWASSPPAQAGEGRGEGGSANRRLPWARLCGSFLSTPLQDPLHSTLRAALSPNRRGQSRRTQSSLHKPCRRYCCRLPPAAACLLLSVRVAWAGTMGALRRVLYFGCQEQETVYAS